jgi:hypothetical protein
MVWQAALGAVKGGASLGFGSSKQKSSSTTTSEEEYSELIQRLNAGDQEAVRELLARFSTQQTEGDQFGRTQALADVQGQVEGLYQQYSQQKLPEILSAQTAAGAYESTTGQRLANQAFAETTAEAAKLQLGAVAAYADIQSQIRQTAQQGIGISLDTLLKAQEETSGDVLAKSTTTGTSKGKTMGFGMSVGK